MKTEALIDFIRKFGNVPEEQAQRLARCGKQQRIKKGDVYIRAGEVPRHFAFLVKGLFRYYYLDKQGREFTKGFFAENSFLSSYSAMIVQRGSHFTIEALEDSEIFVIDFLQWSELRETHPCWDKLLVSVLEKGFIKKEERERQLLLFDAEKRYELFLAQYPGLSERVSQRMIASYLGITSVALSRTRKKMGVLT